MKEFFKHLKWMSIIEALAGIILGSLMIFCTELTIKSLIYIFSMLVIIVGVVKIINYFLYGIESYGAVLGVVNLVLGLVFICNVNAIASTNILGIVFGIVVLIKSIFAIKESLNLRALGAKRWWLDMLLSVLLLSFAIVTISHSAPDKIMFTWLGITIIISGVLSLVDIFAVSAKVKKTKKTLKDIFTIEDDDNIIDI